MGLSFRTSCSALQDKEDYTFHDMTKVFLSLRPNYFGVLFHSLQNCLISYSVDPAYLKYSPVERIPVILKGHFFNSVSGSVQLSAPHSNIENMWQRINLIFGFNVVSLFQIVLFSNTYSYLFAVVAVIVYVGA